jgi:hypothetical protein
MWTYAQGGGELSRDGMHVATGYSGFGEGKNNPALQGVPDVGPIPRGYYLIGAPEHVTTAGPHGPFVLRLVPDVDTRTAGRAGFLMHGDSIEHPGAASHGCIIMPRAVRELVAASGDRRLRVVA